MMSFDTFPARQGSNVKFTESNRCGLVNADANGSFFGNRVVLTDAITETDIYHRSR